MKVRKFKGEPVVYTPVGETFVAKNGKTYKVMPDRLGGLACLECDFQPRMGLCGRYRCLRDDRADNLGVHFVLVK